jgi:release factor glutamine methyltransferase
MTSVAERLAHARAQLAAAGLSPADAALDAEVLARHVLDWDRGALVVHGREAEPPGFAERFSALVARRAAREPVAQIIGHREFWGLDFEVTSDVLVPRPETEIIVEEAVAFAASHVCGRVADVGTGSGCLAIAIARELPDVHVFAIDVSPAALAVARRNAHRLDVAARVTCLEGNLLDPLRDTVDLIVSNPPYLPDGDVHTLQPEVLLHEPPAALFGGSDGLQVIRRLLSDAPPHLAANGRLVVEFGFGQRELVVELARLAGWRVLRVRDDLQGIARTIVLTRNANG